MSSDEVIRILKRSGWTEGRKKGSHQMLVHPTKGSVIPVPHPRKDLGKGLLRAIERSTGVKLARGCNHSPGEEAGSMRYGAVLKRDGKGWLATFPDCPGLATWGSESVIEEMSKDAMVGWLESHLDLGGVPPRPRRRLAGKRILWVEVPAVLAAKIALRQARTDAKLSQAELATRAEVSQPMIAKLENPDIDIRLGTLEKVAAVLGLVVDVRLETRKRSRETSKKAA